MLVVGLGVALLCALATNVAFLCRHRGAPRSPRSNGAVLADVEGAVEREWFAIGMGVALVAWVLHVAALALAPMTLVQVAISAGLVFLAVLAERYFGISMGRKQWVAVIVMAVGLGLVTAAAPAPKGAHSSYSTPGMIAFQAVILVLAAVFMAIRPRGARYVILLGTAAAAARRLRRCA